MPAIDQPCPACDGATADCGCCHGHGLVSAATVEWWGNEGLAELEKIGFAMRRTCPECPWRSDVPTGQFPPARFLSLKRTCEQGLGNPIFACHKSPEGQERACAGFLLVEGLNSFAVRLAMIRGALDPQSIKATGPLYGSFEEMAIANGVPVDQAQREQDHPNGLA